MEQEKIQYFKKRLEDEHAHIETALKSLGLKDQSTAEGWSATEGEIDSSATQSDEVADNIETLEENQSELRHLSVQQKNVARALQKIEEGTYGVCEISGEGIEEERLEANPSARTSKAHIGEEATLEE